MEDENSLKTIEKAALAGLLIHLEERELKAGLLDKKAIAKVEIILSKAGFTPTEIASLTGKNLAAVRKTLQRNRE